MKLRGTASLALLMSGALLLGACTSDDTETEGAKGDATASAANPTESDDPCLKDLGIKETADGQVSFTAGEKDWNGYNASTADTYSTYNSVIDDQLRSGFTYFGTDGTICRDEEYGTIEVLSEDPLKVKYTISDKAVWSDGTPITINDYLLDWAAQNPEFVAPGFISKGDKKAVVFNHVSTSLAEKVPEGPQGEVGSKTFTIEYSSPNPDYLLEVTSVLPAHVAAKKSGLEPDALAKAILDRDGDTVRKVAKFWNEGWLYNPGELPKDMSEIPSAGPYKIKENGWKASESLTLTANDKYWGKPAATKDLVFRFLAEDVQAQALQNGDVQVITPQVTSDTVGNLEAMGDSVKVYKYPTLTWEHLDFNFREGNLMTNQKVREAFAMCVPRQDIVDKLIKPIDPEAQVMNAREVFPFQADKYEAVTSKSYDGRYDKVDIEGAKAKLAEAGVKTPVKVRIGYQAPNPRRSDTLSSIQSKCKEAGFQIEDVSSDKFFDDTLPKGAYEVAMFAWSGSGQKVSGQNIYATGKPQNYGEYSNKKVDEAFKKIASSLDEKVQQEQTIIVEKELWDTLYGIPLFAHPGLVGADARLENIRPTSTQSQVSWNAHQWVAAS